MTAPDVAALRALCDAATPGPWGFKTKDWIDGGVPLRARWLTGAHLDYNHPLGTTEGDYAEADAAFIAAARTALPQLLDAYEAAQRRAEEARQALKSEDGGIILGYIDDIRALKTTLDDAHRAMKQVCGDEEPEDEGIIYVGLDENGDPQIEASTLAEAITQLGKWFGDFQRAQEKKVWSLEETVRKDEETMGTYRRINIEQTERADRAESRLARLTAAGRNALNVGHGALDAIEDHTGRPLANPDLRQALDRFAAALGEPCPNYTPKETPDE